MRDAAVDRDLLLGTIQEARRRLAARRAWRWGGRVGLAAAAAVLALALLQVVLPLDLPAEVLAAAGLVLGGLTAVTVRAASRISPLQAARVLDLRTRGADRLTTAVELLTGRLARTALADVAVDDAAAHAAGIDLRRTLPVGPDRTAAGAAACAVAAVLVAQVLAGLALPGTPARQVVETIRREGRRLARVGEAIEEQARAERARVARRMAPNLQRLGEALQRERVTRGDALGRLEALGREVEAERRAVQQRRQSLAGERPQAAPEPSADLFRQRAALDRAVRQIREIADRLAESRSPQEREQLMRQLAALAGGEDGNVPARARQQAETAREQVGAGDIAGARRTLQQSASDLEDLRAMLAEDEYLQQAQRSLQQSSEQIARGAAPAGEPEQPPQAEAQPGQPAPGNRPPQPGTGKEPTQQAQGPHEGTMPGQGAIEDKLGGVTPRLEGRREQSRLRGVQGEGRTTMSELPGPGRPGQVRVPPGPAVAAARADADRYLARLRVPPAYREIVRRYFARLAESR